MIWITVLLNAAFFTAIGMTLIVVAGCHRTFYGGQRARRAALRAAMRSPMRIASSDTYPPLKTTEFRARGLFFVVRS